MRVMVWVRGDMVMLVWMEFVGVLGERESDSVLYILVRR